MLGDLGPTCTCNEFTVGCWRSYINRLACNSTAFYSTANHIFFIVLEDNCTCNRKGNCDVIRAPTSQSNNHLAISRMSSSNECGRSDNESPNKFTALNLSVVSAVGFQMFKHQALWFSPSHKSCKRKLFTRWMDHFLSVISIQEMNADSFRRMSTSTGVRN